MSFLAPLALAGLLFLPVVLAMYLLKLRRDEAVVPSTMLWQKLVADVEANAPWQKLRRSLLLLLQLLLVLILVLLAARPFVERPAGLAGDIVLVIDTSASMQATDVAPSRLDAAKAAAIDALKELPGRRQGQRHRRGPDRAGRRQRHDRHRQRQAGDRGDRSRPPTSATWATRCGWRRRWPRARATPRSWSRPTRRWPRRRQGTLDAPVRVLQVGREARNEAIVALAIRTVAQRPVALRVRLGGEPRPHGGRAADPALRRRRPARLAGPRPRPPAPDRTSRSTTSTTPTTRRR